MKPTYRLILQYICKKIIKQGYSHQSNTIEYFKIMRSAAEKEFFEDTKMGISQYLEECLEKSKMV